MAGTFKSLTHCDVCLISPVLKEGRNNYHQITHLSWTVGFWQYHETEINMWNCSCIASKNNITKESISKNCTCTVKKNDNLTCTCALICFYVLFLCYLTLTLPVLWFVHLLFRVSPMGARTRPTGPCRPGSSRPSGKMHLMAPGSPHIPGFGFLMHHVHARKARVLPQFSWIS